MEYNYNGYQDSEIVIGLVGAVGVDLNQVIDNLKDQFNFFSYNIKMIKISEHVISVLSSEFDAPPKRCDRVNYLIEKGNTLREKTKDNAFMAKAVAANISFYRNINKKKAKKDNPLGRVAFIISSLKTPDEVHELRKIYSDGFFLIGVYSSESLRLSELTKKKYDRRRSRGTNRQG